MWLTCALPARQVCVLMYWASLQASPLQSLMRLAQIRRLGARPLARRWLPTLRSVRQVGAQQRHATRIHRAPRGEVSQRRTRAPVALYMDAVPYLHTDSVVGVLAVARHLGQTRPLRALAAGKLLMEHTAASEAHCTDKWRCTSNNFFCR